MILSDFVSEKRRLLFDELLAGHPPPEGTFDEDRFKEGKDKGTPQMGTVRYEPDAVLFEFIYPYALGAPILLTVRIPTPERVVFMPVPAWVVASVWEGDVAGSFRFESEARDFVRGFQTSLEPEVNKDLFYQKVEIGRH